MVDRFINKPVCKGEFFHVGRYIDNGPMEFRNKLSETHSILQRMRELAVQSSNDTNTDTDRAELQKEVDQLSQEISRIGANTEFNTQNLLDGSFSGKFHIGANSGQNLSVSVDKMAEKIGLQKLVNTILTSLLGLTLK